MCTLIRSIQSWMYSVLLLGLSPLAVYVGSLWQGMPGVASFAILAVPSCAAALSGNRAVAVATASIAAMSSFVEVWVTEGPVNGGWPFTFPILATCVLFGLNAIVVSVAHGLRQRIGRLEEQNTQYVRSIYQRDRESADAGAVTDGATRAEEERSQQARDEDTVNFAMLLLTLQDIGRRVSTNLDLDTLIPTIISSAKASLKCVVCQVYLWNARAQLLGNPLPTRPRDIFTYVPRADSGMAGWVIERRQILTRQDIEKDYTLQSLIEEEPTIPDAIAPLSVGEEFLGILIVDGIQQDSATFERLLYILANMYALGIKNAQLFKRIDDMAHRDGLTGLLNYATFQEQLTKLIDEASSCFTPLCVIMSDVDHFKKFNDSYGHQAGDHVLREVSRLWSAVLPDHATIARYGGEEFICALPHEALPRGRELAELMQTTTDSHIIDFEGQQLHVTASFGVAELSGEADNAVDLIRLADESLYRAKAEGRNRVVCHTHTAPLAQLPNAEGGPSCS